jgi:hypothetical protein
MEPNGFWQWRWSIFMSLIVKTAKTMSLPIKYWIIVL